MEVWDINALFIAREGCWQPLRGVWAPLKGRYPALKRAIYLNSCFSLSLALMNLLLVLGVSGGRIVSDSVASGDEAGLMVLGGYGKITTGSVCVEIFFTDNND